MSSGGKADGEVYFPRDIQRHGDKVLVIDKTGRIQRFDASGKFIDVAATIDAYLGNAFTTRNDSAIIACSGIVKDRVSTRTPARSSSMQREEAFRKGTQSVMTGWNV